MTVPPLLIRDAAARDAAACAAIYSPYVTDTPITFELAPPDAAEFERRIAQAQHGHAWLVAERDGEVVGYAYAGPFESRAAYDWSCTTSVYLRRGLRRTGAGRALMQALLDRLGHRGFRRAFAGVALPNEPSTGLHRALGFRDAAVFERVGFKLGSWHDVAWLQCDLGAPDAPNAPPLPLR